MDLRFTYKRFFNGTSDNTKHFLLKSGTLQLTLLFHDNSELVINVPQHPVTGNGFVAKIIPAIIPDLPAPMPGTGFRKKQIVRIRCVYSMLLTHAGKRYELLRITQLLTATPGQGHSDSNLVYTLAPSGWHDISGVFKLGNAAAHPLVELDKLAQNEIRLCALIVNLTELWHVLHANNINYTIYRQNLSNTQKVTFLVFGNLAGNAFIWYACVPRYLHSMTRVSPHVFFQPSDNADKQNLSDDHEYLFNNTARLNNDGKELLTYLLPPVTDAQLPTLPPVLPELPGEWNKWRNTVAFHYLDKERTKIGTMHWNIPHGLEKAFYGDDGVKPKQFLLMPQNVGEIKTAKSTKGVQTLGPATALRDITREITLTLQTNTTLLARDSADKVVVDKLVLSAYSESGFDLWIAVRDNMQSLKAIIAVEPQNMNTLENGYGVNPPLGKDVLKKLVEGKTCKIFIVGRHHTPKYKPDIPDTTGIVFMPAEPKKVLHYPPDPTSNPFVRYRVERMTDRSLDPLMRESEANLLNDLAHRKPPVTGTAVLPELFPLFGDVDCTCGEANCACPDKKRDSWYTHQYALSGGQIMQLPPTGSIYNQPIAYKTFFQEAVDAIG